MINLAKSKQVKFTQINDHVQRAIDITIFEILNFLKKHSHKKSIFKYTDTSF